MSDTAATFCATLVDEWVRAGVAHAVVAPGSRSTPMALALVADGRIRVHVHHDERAAGFVALGIARATGMPAVVLTTSGTAAVELHPAVVEAHEAQVAMVAVTADRPPEVRRLGAPQTIDQVHLFGGAVRWFVEPGVPDEGARGHWRSIAARAVLAATGSPPGPVHLNLSFREPLIGAPGELPPGRPTGVAWHGAPAPEPALTALDSGALADGLRGRRGIIVAGGGIAAAEPVHALAGRLRWPVLADPRSGCRLPRSATISHADALLRHDPTASRLRPDVVLRLGGQPASKVLARWLAASDAWQLGVSAHGSRHDPEATLASLLPVEPSAFCARLLGDIGPATPSPEGWFDGWASADAEAAAAIREVLAGHAEPTEPAIARDVVAAMPAGGQLVVSSSMPVRDVEWYAAPRDGLTVHANRGANGIDGVISTGFGVALASGAPTVVLIGDIAFLHDASALTGIARRDLNLTIVVVDNDGGGIFSFLPQADELDTASFEQLFGTPHGTDLVALAAAHGCGARRVDRQADLAPALDAALRSDGTQVITVGTDRGKNVAVHDEIHDAVAAALDRFR